MKIPHIVCEVRPVCLFLRGAASSIRFVSPSRRKPMRSAESWITMSPSIQEERPEIAAGDDDRTGIKVETLKQAVLDNLRHVLGREPEFASDIDYFQAIAYTVRERILARWLAPRRNYSEHNVRVVCYLSAE